MLDIYELALDNERGVNASALLQRLNESTEVMWAEAHALGLGTDYVNTHPVMIVLVDRLYNLAHPNRSGIYQEHHTALGVCRERAGTDYSQRLLAEKGTRGAPA
jgi:hypothetical protein